MASARPPHRGLSTHMWWLASRCSPKRSLDSWIAALSPLCSPIRRPNQVASSGSPRRHSQPPTRFAASGATTSAHCVALRTATFARASFGAPASPPPHPQPHLHLAQAACSSALGANEHVLVPVLIRTTRSLSPLLLPLSLWPIGASFGSASHFMCSSGGLQLAPKLPRH